MPYIEPFNLIFIHIPKTGGSFIENKLREINIELYSNYEVFGGHDTINHYIINLNIDDIALYNIFSVVRNPYNRIISAYNYLKDTERRCVSDKNEWEKLGSPGNITDFISSIYSKYKNNELLKINSDNQHFQQQYKFVVDEKNTLSSNILKYENLDKDFEKYITGCKDQNEKLYNLLYNKIYKNINIKKDYDILNILSSNDINMINEIYKVDFYLFEYDTL